MATSLARHLDQEDPSVFDADSQGYSRMFNVNYITQAGENRERRDREDANIQMASMRDTAAYLNTQLYDMGADGDDQDFGASMANFLVACGMDRSDPLIRSLSDGAYTADDLTAGVEASYRYNSGAGLGPAARNVRYDGTFETASAMFLRFEGGHARHLQGETGGTIMGITERWFPREYARAVNLWYQDQDAARGYAREFYREHFWNPIVEYVDERFGNLPQRQRQALYLMGFDMACHSGVDVAERFLRRSQGNVVAMMDDRRGFLHGLENAQYYRRGWDNRLDQLGGQVAGFLQTASAPAPAPAFA
jgi:lysozyme family protein